MTVLVLVAALAKYLQHWPRFWDVLLWDETNHLGAGVFNWFGPPRSYEAQALYSLLYKALAPIFSDTVELFFVVGLIDIVAATVAIFVSVWLLSESVFLASASASILVGSNALLVTPRALFAAIFVLSLGLALSLRQSSFLARSSGATLTLYLATYLRPDFVGPLYFTGLTALLAGVLALVRDSPRPAASKLKQWTFPIACGLLIALLQAQLIFPFIRGDRRAFMAFGQAFAWRWVQAHPGGADGGLIWDQVVDRELPGARSELDALIRYPSKMIEFLWSNASEAPERLWWLWGDAFTFSRGWTILLCCALAIWLVSAARDARLSGREGGSSGRGHALWWDLLLLLPPLVGPTLAVLLIFPREHYLLLWTSSFILVAARLARGVPATPIAPWLATLVALALLMTVTPLQPIPRPTLDTILALRSHSGIHRMFEIGHGWCAYLAQPCLRHSAFGLPPTMDYATLIDKGRIDTIVVTPELLDVARTRNEASFLETVSSPGAAGWTEYQVGEKTFLLVR
jgi:hypothetical protein